MRGWLAGRVGRAPGAVVVSELSAPSGNGLSSETLIFDSEWDGRRVGCVARMAPAEDAVPVFPEYDLRKQYDVMRLVRERAGVPAPRTLWYEPDPAHLGSPFFVMEREEGLVPRDVMPYTIDGWLVEAAPHELERLQRLTVEVLARLHDAPFAPEELEFLRPSSAESAGECALRRHVEDQRAYYEWAHGERRIPVLEAAFAALEDLWPDDPGPDVVSWGDARIGNVIYREFRPVAVLDWEMASLGPREIDLGWMIFLHRFFQDLTEGLGLPGLPGFMRRADVCAQYRSLTGHEPRHMRFYELYAALRHGIIMARVWQRRIHFGEQPMPDDPDDLVMHRATIEAMLDGSYWRR
ncbi:phosphotransferase family protein [Thermocatellispora tengchongensis]